MKETSYAILGTGALGGFYGARLQRAGLDVHFLLNSDYDHVRRHGLRIDSKDGDFSLPYVAAYASVEQMPRCDVVVLGLKTTSNHLLPHLLPPLLGDETTVLVLQNGLGIEEEVARIAGADRVLGGLCFLCSNKLGPGHICHLDYGAITMAQYTADGSPAGLTPRLRRVAADFERTGIPITLAEDLVDARWRKLAWNITFNGLTVLLDATTDQIMGSPAGHSLAEGLMAEVVAGAAACGRTIPADFIQLMLAMTARMTPYRPSMKIDYDTGRPMEVEAIFGNPLRTARQAGVALPKIEMVYHQLCFLAARNQGKR